MPTTLREKLNVLFHTFPWQFWILYFVIIPVILIAFIIPPGYGIGRSFILNLKQPTIEQMYLSNFISGSLADLQSTLSMYLIATLSIFILERNVERLRRFTLFALGPAPFIYAVLTLVLARSIPTALHAGGFSGIAFSYLGYFFFLLLLTIFLRLRSTNSLAAGFVLIFLFVLMAFIAVALAFFGGQLTPLNSTALSNGMAHLAGYLFGFMIPFLVTIL